MLTIFGCFDMFGHLIDIVLCLFNKSAKFIDIACI